MKIINGKSMSLQIINGIFESKAVSTFEFSTNFNELVHIYFKYK